MVADVAQARSVSRNLIGVWPSHLPFSTINSSCLALAQSLSRTVICLQHTGDAGTAFRTGRRTWELPNKHLQTYEKPFIKLQALRRGNLPNLDMQVWCRAASLAHNFVICGLPHMDYGLCLSKRHINCKPLNINVSSNIH